MAHIILFEHQFMRGAHKHVFSAEPNLNADDDSSFNDKASSIAVIEHDQNWALYADWHYKNPYSTILGPGTYVRLEVSGIRSDEISSLQPTRQEASVFNSDADTQIILFEHENFRGAHKHVFLPGEPDLGAPEDNYFSGKVSSMAVLAGNWAFYGKPEWDAQSMYPPILGPGAYPRVASVQIPNDEISSLQPTINLPTVKAPLIVDQGVILFENADFHGSHKHVIAKEANLNSSEDSDFNDIVSSFVVRDRAWSFYSDWNFQGDSAIGVLPGLYPSADAIGVWNDTLSSLEPTV